ncbi:MAG: methyltransferase domain-containing protein [Campylobacterales bacterium]|nr:methyltransferase domain-containing protein [Campylobacterales bacterium]
MEITHQRKTWEDQFGEEYLKRNVYNPKELNELYNNRFGFTKDQINDQFLKDIPKDAKILEVGTNIGNQLFHLQSQGFTNLYGIEIQSRAINYAKHRTDNLNIIKGDALDIPFKDNYFDVVFTHGVLIHISPANINKVLDEIYRVTKKYIWGFEYYAPVYTDLEYHGQKNLMWKTDFCRLYQEQFPTLNLIKEQKYKYLTDANLEDQIYLLSK